MSKAHTARRKRPTKKPQKQKQLLSHAVIRDLLKRGTENVVALEEQLGRMFILREHSATLKLT